MNVLKVLKDNSEGLRAVSENCSSMHLAAAMHNRIKELDEAIEIITETFKAARAVTEVAALSADEVAALSRLIKALEAVGEIPRDPYH